MPIISSNFFAFFAKTLHFSHEIDTVGFYIYSKQLHNMKSVPILTINTEFVFNSFFCFISSGNQSTADCHFDEMIDIGFLVEIHRWSRVTWTGHFSLFLCTTDKMKSKSQTLARKKNRKVIEKKIFNESLFFLIGRLPICDSVTCFCRSTHRWDKNIRKTVNRDEDYTRIVMSGRKKKQQQQHESWRKKNKTTTTHTYDVQKKKNQQVTIRFCKESLSL